jgi:flagellar biosynthesis protein FliR
MIESIAGDPLKSLASAWTALCIVVRLLPMSIVIPQGLLQGISLRMQGVMAILLAGCLVPLVQPDSPALPIDWAHATMALAVELLLGSTIACAAFLGIHLVQLGADWLAHSAGLDTTSSSHALHGQSSSGEGKTAFHLLLGLCSIAWFLGIGAHQALVRMWLESFQRYAPGGLSVDPDWVAGVLELIPASALMGLRLVAPIAFVVMASQVTSGLIAKVLPGCSSSESNAPIRLALLLGSLAAMVYGMERSAVEGWQEYFQLVDLWMAGVGNGR